ncbi:MAG TPA: cyclase family protein [Microlunatus sp.]
MTTRAATVRPHPPTPGTLIDLSMPIVEHWRFPVRFEHTEHVAEGQPFYSTSMRIGAHSFTHVDSPRHVRPDGAPLGEVDLGRLWGEAAVVDLSPLGDDAAISADDLDTAGRHVQSGDIVLLRSDHELRHPTTTPEYWTAAPYVSASAAHWLADREVRAVGFDFPQDRATRSPYQDGFTRHALGQDEDWACHHLLLDRGIPQIEYLSNLRSLPDPRVLFFALPLNLPDHDGAPTRAFAVLS